MTDTIVNYFAVLSDTHIGADCGYEYEGYIPFERSKRAVKYLSELPVTLDCILHTGDIAGDKKIHCNRSSSKLSAEIFSELPADLFWVAGNHDDVELLRAAIPVPSRAEVLLESKDELSYFFTEHDVEFLAMHSSSVNRLSGSFSAEQWRVLDQRLQHQSDKSLILFLHHPPLPVFSPWMDQNMLLVDGEKFHQKLVNSARKVLAVFSGHVHQNRQLLRDNIFYSSAAPVLLEFDQERSVEQAVIPRWSPIGITLVAYGKDTVQTSTRYLSFGEESL